jgi:CRP/FNR family transcriptional regulator, cyclic AMP receptor protein
MSRRVPKEQLDMLARVPLFSACSQKELREVARLGTPIDVSAGRQLTREGNRGSEFFLVLKGRAQCTINGRKVASFRDGDFFGEMALLDQGPRTATVTADTDMRLLVVSAREFAELLNEAPSIGRKMLQTLASRLRDLEKSRSH